MEWSGGGVRGSGGGGGSLWGGRFAQQGEPRGIDV